MKQILTILTLVILSVMSIYGKSKAKIEGAAINVAVLLVDEPNLDQMVSLCKYYNLTQATPEDNYTVFTHSDGSKIRFKIDEEEGHPSSIVELITNQKPKNIEKILTDLKFKKTSEGFERVNKYNHQTTYISIAQLKPLILILSRGEK